MSFRGGFRNGARYGGYSSSRSNPFATLLVLGVFTSVWYGSKGAARMLTEWTGSRAFGVGLVCCFWVVVVRFIFTFH